MKLNHNQSIQKTVTTLKAKWQRPTVQRIDIKRTLKKTGSVFDGGSSTPASKLP